MNSKAIGKLFGVLVLSGVSIAHAKGTDPVVEEEPICQVAVVQTKYKMRGDAEILTVCIDEKSDEETDKIIEEARAESCSTPFCGCWLG